MRKHLMPAVHSAHPNVTPLIDIVMCLIIFFMLVAKIGVSTGAEAMTIPATITGKAIEDLGNTLTLNVRPGSGEDPLITALVSGQMQELKVRDSQGRAQLMETLRFLRFGPREKPVDNPNFAVIVRAEEGLQYRYLQPVLMAAAEARVKNVSFNTRKGDVVGMK